MNTFSKIIATALVAGAAMSAQAATKVVQLDTVVISAKRVAPAASADVRHLPTVVVVASRSEMMLARANSKTRKA